MLCALSTQREQTLCALDLKNKKESGTCLSFVITERLKTSKPGKSTEVTFERLPDQPQICTSSHVPLERPRHPRANPSHAWTPRFGTLSRDLAVIIHGVIIKEDDV